MNYIKITKHDIANGVGVRVVLWVSGCTVHCYNCQNSSTWDFTAGQPFTNNTMTELLEELSPDYISGLTLSGGHPLDQANQQQISNIVKTVKTKLPNKTIWLYTGYTYEQILKSKFIVNEILPYIDILVDGKYDYTKRDITLAWCGSSNQRVIDIQKSLKGNKVILFKKE
ncbi:anaerobic ribonucleoside-triphosphate reductase activating protein [Ruminococcus sp. AF42-10]|nr:anaerobic ribonucleoside-triphosphate reductase activating protein [Ruminococcus sp. AF42-10]RGF39381.1 anaerobic ribonucleoside-triphosphate reductase activating protein [Ruminococcus sp. AF42-10]